MKTQILQLEAHDDAISTRDKMSWGQAGRILLVWPSRGRVLARRLDLVLIQRRSKELGAQLALVTRDTSVLFHARNLGIQTFPSLRQAQEKRWKRNPRRKGLRQRAQYFEHDQRLRELLERPRPLSDGPIPSPLFRLAFFTIGVLAVLSIAAAIFPSAEISFIPQSRIQEITLPVEATASIQNVDLAGRLPIQSASAIVEGRDNLVTSGSIQVPDHAATGQVLFTNLTDRPITVPAGTIVSTPGSRVQFATDRAGQVPAGPGQTLSLPATAVTAGDSGNLPGGRLQAIEGPLGVHLTVTNPDATWGGSNLLSPAPTPLDQSRLYNRLLSTLEQSAMKEMRASLGPNDVLLSTSPAEGNDLEKTFTPANFEPASQLDLVLRIEFKAPIVSGEDLQDLAESVLDANLPDGYVPVPGTLTIKHLTNPQLTGEAGARWQIRAMRSIQARLREDQAVNLAVGQSPVQASQRLTNALSLASPPHILVKPAWWPRLPLLPFRISVVEIQ